MKPFLISDINQWHQNISKHNDKRSFARAMYSSFFDGIVTDPSLMLTPIDDHQVHRGDAVFEAVKIWNFKPYAFKEHLERLLRSAAAIGLKPKFNLDEMIVIGHEVAAASKLEAGVLRIFLSRGPGSFTQSPFDTIGSQFMIIATTAKFPTPDELEKGVSVAVSKYISKDSFFAQIKSCNYLLNVLMKAESVERKVHYTVALNDAGYMTESSTENIAWIDQNGLFTYPPFNSILRGITLSKVISFAERCTEPFISGVAAKSASLNELKNAREMMILGTTHGVIPITNFEDKNLPVGAATRWLRTQLEQDENKHCS